MAIGGSMSGTIDGLVRSFEGGQLTRRELVAAIAALVAGSAGVASAQSPAVAQGRSINHVSMAVADVEKSAVFYSKLLGLKEVSRPGNGGINLGLGTSFLGLYKIQEPGRVHHVCIGVDDYDPERIAARLKEQGVQATVDRNPAN